MRVVSAHPSTQACVPPSQPVDFLVNEALCAASRATGLPYDILRSFSVGPVKTPTGSEDVTDMVQACRAIRMLTSAAQRELFNGVRSREEQALLYAATKSILLMEEAAREALFQALLRYPDPVVVVRALHQRDDLGFLSQNLTALLGITDERIGGELEKHSADERKTFNARGGYMYQASDGHEIRSLFSKVHFRSGTSFYDLGSGYGHVVFYGAIVRPDIEFKGIELMSSRTAECERVKIRLGITNLSFEAADVVRADISHADVLFLFNPFPPDVRVEVSQKINERARQGKLVVIDYGGMVTQDAHELIPATSNATYPYRVAISRRFREDSLELARVESVSEQKVKKGGSR